MQIYLLRHAEAASAYPDHSRPLTDAGRQHVRNLGGFLLKSSRLNPAAIWRSPYLRAQQTTEILSEVLDFESLPLTVREDLTPESNPQSVFDAIAAQKSDLLIVGHNPHLSILCSLLLGAERGRLRVHLQTCNLVCLEWFPIPNHGQTGPCELNWLLDPRLL